MAKKLPADFDPERYAAAYPDVALSGLSPAEHYRRFGEMLGRSQAPTVAQAAATKKAKAGTDSTVRKEPKRSDPLISRPADFDPEESVVRPAPQRRGVDADGRLALELLEQGVRPELTRALNAYRQLTGVETAEGAKPGLGAGEFISGGTRIENAWVAADGVLRLMVGQQTGDRAGWVVRVYQADAEEPARLVVLGTGAALPKRGPALIECTLHDALMPLLVELSDVSGATEAVALLPFPSLLPGGLHNAELRALQAEPNPMHSFWSLSEVLLEDLTIRDASVGSISEIGSLDSAGQQLESSDLVSWLKLLFGFSGSETLSRTAEGGLRLLLPANSIPTISALTAGAVGSGGSGRATCPYLVADAENRRPRWSVTLPADWDAGENAPVMEDASGATAAPAVPVAIAFRELPQPSPPEVGRPNAGGLKRSARPKISVVLDASEAERCKAIVGELEAAIGADRIELFVRTHPNAPPVAAALDGIRGTGRWTSVAPGTPLSEIAAQASNDLLLTISDHVDAVGAATVDSLVDLLKNEQIASASCLLLHEVSLKKQKVLQPATGGLFPAGVSFATSPSLTFAEPDVLQALDGITYPVAANTLHLTLWRRAALADLGISRTPVPTAAEDIRIGLALTERGLLNVCTTKVCAKLNGPYVPRDAIDPVGQMKLLPSDWQQLLGRVTLLRQLF